MVTARCTSTKKPDDVIFPQGWKRFLELLPLVAQGRMKRFDVLASRLILTNIYKRWTGKVVVERVPRRGIERARRRNSFPARLFQLPRCKGVTVGAIKKKRTWDWIAWIRAISRHILPRGNGRETTVPRRPESKYATSTMLSTRRLRLSGTAPTSTPPARCLSLVHLKAP
jgi:hypothetical protein